MSIRVHSWLVLLLACGACKSYGPRLDLGAKTGLSSEAFLQLEDTNNPPASLLQPSSDYFRLGPGDVIEVEVIGDAASSTSLTVGPDGKIYYSILPGTTVWGLTLAQTKTALESRLAETLRLRPELGVTLRTAASPKLWVLGNIERPGVYTLAAPMTLLELVSTSGGVSVPGGLDIGDLGRSFVMRDGTILDVDFYRLVRLGDLRHNIYLQPGDYVYLGSSAGREVYVLGAVALPTTMPYAPDLSLLAVIARAGGPVPYAHLSEVVLVRGSLSMPRVATVNFHEIRKGKVPDVKLESGDIVYVPFSPFRKIEQLADQVLSEFVRTLAVNEGRNAVIRGAEPVGVSLPFGP